MKNYLVFREWIEYKKPKSKDLGSFMLFLIMDTALKKVLLFFPSLLLFQLVLSVSVAMIGPVINLGQFKFVELEDRMFTFYLMGLWIGVGFYWTLYLFFVLFPKLNRANWQVVFHLLMALAFTLIWGQNAGGLMFLAIPLLLTTFLNFFFLKRVFN